MNEGNRPPEPVEASAAEEIKQLQAAVKDIHRQRVNLQRHLAERPAAERGVTIARRDRSSRTSPDVDNAREHTQRLYEELQEHWGKVDNIRMHVASLRHVQFPGMSELRAALAAEADLRNRHAADLTDAGSAVRVPAPYDPNPTSSRTEGDNDGTR